MKKFLICLLSLLCLCSFAACGGQLPPEQPQKPTISVNQAVINLKPYQTFDLIVSYSGTEQITFENSNPSAATIDQNGKITAIAVGNTVITVSAGEEADPKTCYVYVSENTEVPFIIVKNVEDGILGLRTGDTFELDANAYFVGDEIDIDLSYSSSDSQIVAVNNEGIITANGIGEAFVYVKGSYLNYDEQILCGSIKVVVGNVDFTATATEKEIYVIDEYEGQSYITNSQLNVALNVDGQAINSGFTYSVEDPSIATVSQTGEITAKKQGQTKVYCHYTSSVYGEIYAYDTITVKPIINENLKGKKLDDSLFFFSKNIDGQKVSGYAEKNMLNGKYVIDLPDSVVGEELLSFTINNLSVEAEYDALQATLSVPVNAVENYIVSDQTAVITTNVGVYTSNVSFADYVLTSSNDIREVLPIVTTETVLIDGNITWSGANYTRIPSGSEVATQVNFSGTLDGRGAIIRGMVLTNRMFRNIVANAVIKNVALIDVVNNAWNSAIFAQDITKDVTFENVVLTMPTGASCFGIASSLVKAGDINFNNVIISYPGRNPIARTYVEGTTLNLNNSYILSEKAPFEVDLGGENDAFDVAQAVTYQHDSEVTIASNGFEGFTDKCWKFNGDGDLFFGSELILEKVVSLVGEKNDGELFYFSKNVTDATGYASAYVENGYYKIAMPQGFKANIISNLTIGGKTITDFIYANGVLKIATSAVSDISNGVVGMNFKADGVKHQAKVTVADLVIKTENDINLLRTIDTVRDVSLFVLDGDITCSNDYVYSAGKKWFYGTLDGKGHAIKNLVIGATGETVARLFWGFQPNAAVKNLALINVAFGDDVTSGGIFGTESGSSIFENVFISVAENKGVNAIFKGFISYVHNLTNVVVVYNGLKGDTDTYALGNEYGASTTLRINLTNVYAITDGTPFATGTNTYVDYEAINKVAVANLAALKTASENLKGFSDLWSIDNNGNLCFGDEIVISAQSN